MTKAKNIKEKFSFRAQKQTRVRTTHQYMTAKWRTRLLREVDDAGYILFEYLLSSSTNPRFTFSDDKILADLGWSLAKLKRQKKKLIDNGWLHIIKNKLSNNRVLIEVFMGPNEALAAKHGVELPLDESIMNMAIRALGYKPNKPDEVEAALRSKNFKEAFQQASDGLLKYKEKGVVMSVPEGTEDIITSHEWANENDYRVKFKEIHTMYPPDASEVVMLLNIISDAMDGLGKPEDTEARFNSLYHEAISVELY